MANVPMPQQPNSLVIRAFYEAVNKQDPDGLLAHLSDTIECFDFTLDQPIRGREEVLQYFQNWWTAFPKGTGELINMIAAEDQVFIEVIGRGIQNGPFVLPDGTEVPASGRELAFPFCQIFRLLNNEIVSCRMYYDSAFVRRALGVEDIKRAA